MRLFLSLLLLTIGLAPGCARSPAASAIIGDGPTFDPVAFFAGPIHSWGVLESRSGAPTEWITTNSRGTVDTDGKLRMVQHLAFQDGSAQQRDWELWRSGPDQYEATANDMVGTAKGEANGRVFHWQWVLARSPGNALMNVTMSQWMYSLPDGSAIIRTTVSKFGIIIAEVTEHFAHD